VEVQVLSTAPFLRLKPVRMSQVKVKTSWPARDDIFAPGDPCADCTCCTFEYLIMKLKRRGLVKRAAGHRLAAL
jgi:hypothetical protein